MRNIVIMLLISVLVSIGFAGIASTVLQAGRVTVTSFTADRSAVRPGERVRVHAATVDKAGGVLSYTWQADAGRITGPATDTVTWLAPKEEGRYRLSVTVTNAAGSRTKASTDIIVSRYSRETRMAQRPD